GRGAEGDELHGPVAAGVEQGAGAVGAGGGDDAVLNDVAVGTGDHAVGEAGAGSPGRRGHVVRGDEEHAGGGGRESAAARGGARAGRADGGVQRIAGIEAAVLDDADVGIVRGRGEGDGDGVGAGADVLGVVDDVRDLPREGGGRDRRRVRVAGGVADIGDGGGGVAPADGDDVEVAGALSGAKGYADRALRRLRHGVGALHEGDGAALRCRRDSRGNGGRQGHRKRNGQAAGHS